MDRVGSRSTPATLLAGLGAATAAIPAFDVYDDVAAGKSAVSTLIENAPLFALAGFVVATAVWLARTNWSATYRWRVLGWTVGGTVAVAGLFGFVLAVQVHLQSELKPLIIAADGVLVGTVLATVAGLFAVSRDRVSEAQFRALFENVPIPIVSVEYQDGSAYVYGTNPAFETVFGYDGEAIVGEPLDEHLVPEGADVNAFRPPSPPEVPDAEAVTSRETYRFETRRGQREFVRVGVPIDRGSQRDGYGIYIDVSEQRRRRERLNVLDRLLRHDLRNHVNVIRGASEELSERYEHDDLVESVRESADGLLARSERTRFAGDLVSTDAERDTHHLATVVRTVRERVSAATITVDVPEDAVVAATDSFHVAVEEILQNAVEHGREFGEEASVEVTARESLDGDYWDVRIADEGPGIHPREYEVVTGDREYTQVDHATGLGLWIAHWVLEESGGRLSFEANSPTGTVVTLRVPSADAGDGEATGDVDPDPTVEPDAGQDPDADPDPDRSAGT